VGRGEGHTLIAVEKKMVVDQGLHECSSFLGSICIVAHVRTKHGRLKPSFVPLSLGSSVFLNFIVFPRGLTASNWTPIELSRAMILGCLTKSNSTRPHTSVLRREYDLFDAEKCAIEFDENGWRGR